MSLFLRISFIRPITLSVLLTTSLLNGMGQTNAYPYKVAQDRMIWHDKVNLEQQKLFALGGGMADSLIHLSKDETVNLHITDALAAVSTNCSNRSNSIPP